jgi:hypothetical protein
MTDLWAELSGQETAKRAIEVSLVGGHHIGFTPYEGAEYRFSAYDIDRVGSDSRYKDKLYEHLSQFAGAPWTLPAAQHAVGQVTLAAGYLAAICDLDTTTVAPSHAPMKMQIMPISLADLVLPPPAESGEAVARRILIARERRQSASMDVTMDAVCLMDTWNPLPLRYARALSVARSIQLLSSQPLERVSRLSLAEAISYVQ